MGLAYPSEAKLLYHRPLVAARQSRTAFESITVLERNHFV